MIKHILLLTLISGMLMSSPAMALLHCHKAFCPPKQTVEKPKPAQTKK